MQIAIIVVCIFRIIALMRFEMIKKYLSEYKNSVIAFYTHIFILFTSFIGADLFYQDFESGEEWISFLEFFS